MYLPAISQIVQELSTTPARVSMSISSYFIGLGAGQLFYAGVGLLNAKNSVPIAVLMSGATFDGLVISRIAFVITRSGSSRSRSFVYVTAPNGVQGWRTINRRSSCDAQSAAG